MGVQPDLAYWNRQEEFCDEGSQEYLGLSYFLDWFTKAIAVSYIYRTAFCEELRVFFIFLDIIQLSECHREVEARSLSTL